MDIIEATKEAIENGMGITNDLLEKGGFYLLPTNTEECYLIIPFGCSMQKSWAITARWNPTANDILSDKWRVTKTRR